jgi:hypothetical protein
MAPAAVVTTARQPRRTPSSAANGIASAWPPEKPTTSHGIFRRSGLDGQARADRHRVNRSSDLHHQSTHRDNAAVSLDAIYIDDLFGERLHRSAFSAGDAQAINLPLGLPAHALH